MKRHLCSLLALVFATCTTPLALAQMDCPPEPGDGHPSVSDSGVGIPPTASAPGAGEDQPPAVHTADASTASD